MGAADRLSCLRCGRSGARVAWSLHERRFIHTARVRADPPYGAICGGPMMEKSQAWRGGLQAGVVVPCHPTLASLEVHLVALEGFSSRRNGSWAGRAACGRTWRRATRWLPVAPEHGRFLDICRRCLSKAPGGQPQVIDGGT